MSRLFGLTIALSALMIVAGCAGSTSTTDAANGASVAPGHIGCALPVGPVGIAASNRANDPALEVTPSLAAVLHHAVAKQESVALFDTDGSPGRIAALSLVSQAKNPQARQAEEANQMGALVGGIQRSQANDSEADPLGAISLAARAVRAQAAQGTVVLVDNGLQTTGALRYQTEHLLLASGQDVVAYLRSTDQLPDLRGMAVILSGIGDTEQPQARLDAASRNRLVEQWAAIAHAGGAKCVYIDPEPLTDPTRAGLPHVSTVVVPKPARPELNLSRPVALREDSVGFEDNSDKLRDVALARQSLRSIAREIVRGHHHVLLTGTTATAGTEQGRQRLSLMRALAVKGLLVSLGVPTNHITARGVGIHYPEHVHDLDANGDLIPEAAMRNRAVFLSVTR